MLRKVAEHLLVFILKTCTCHNDKRQDISVSTRIVHYDMTLFNKHLPFVSRRSEI